MSRHLSHLTLRHPDRPTELDVESVSGHFRQLEPGTLLVRTATTFRGERVYAVTDVQRHRVAAKTGEPRAVDVEFVIADEIIEEATAIR